MAAQAVAFPAASGMVTPAVLTIFHGFAVKTMAPNTGAFNIRAGSATGTILMPVNLASNESTSEIMDAGIICPAGIYVEITDGAGNITGSIWVS